MTLNSLSNDLLLDITELVALPTQVFYPTRDCYKQATKDLLSFMLCSKRYQLVVERVLYQRFVQNTPYALLKFRKTLLAKPRLLQYVRKVQLRDLEGTDLDPEGVLSDILNLFQFPTEIKRDIEFLEARLSLWYEESISTLLLLPNLEDITITRASRNPTASFPFFNTLRNLLLTHPANSKAQTPQLSNLRKLAIEYHDLNYRTRAGFEDTEFLLALPSLTTFDGDRLLDREWAPSSPDAMFQLRTLRLRESNLSPTVIRNLLSCCPLLEYLIYEHDKHHDKESSFFPHYFRESIAQLQPCLQSLELYRSEKGQYATYISEEFTTIGSLVPFQKLRYLSITAHLLLGPQKFRGSDWYSKACKFGPHQCETQSLANCVPESLEHLRLKDCGSKIFEHVSELLNEPIPNLKFITLCFKHIGGFGNNESSWSDGNRVGGRSIASHSKGIEKLERACRDRGVVLAIGYF